jgi:Phosphoribosyl transferase domain
MDYFILTNYEIQDAKDGALLVLVQGDRVYRSVLERALPNNRLSRIFPDRFGRFDWGTYIYDSDKQLKDNIEQVLELFRKHICIVDDNLTEIFALDFHTKVSPEGFSRTEIGELVYQAKPYSKLATQQTTQKAHELAKHFCTFAKKHPTYIAASIMVAIPPRPGKKFDLPSELVKFISTKLKIKNGSSLIEKVRKTKPMKDCQTIESKIENVRDAFAIATGGDVEGHSVILIDDIYQTGFTMNEVGRVLIEAGASSVLGLTATKTAKDL